MHNLNFNSDCTQLHTLETATSNEDAVKCRNPRYLCSACCMTCFLQVKAVYDEKRSFFWTKMYPSSLKAFTDRGNSQTCAQ